MSYVYDKYVFHYIAVDGLVFMCMSDESMQRRLCFAFLEGGCNRSPRFYVFCFILEAQC